MFQYRDTSSDSVQRRRVLCFELGCYISVCFLEHVLTLSICVLLACINKTDK